MLQTFLNCVSDMHRPSPCFCKSFQTDALFWGEGSGNLSRSCKYFMKLIELSREKEFPYQETSYSIEAETADGNGEQKEPVCAVDLPPYGVQSIKAS